MFEDCLKLTSTNIFGGIDKRKVYAMEYMLH